MRFRPAPVPTGFVAIGLIILLNLGAWQLRRNTTRKAALSTVEMRLDADPASNAEIAAATDYTPFQWRKANLRGQFHDVPPEYLAGRFEFGEPGFDLIQPFQIEDGPSIQVVRGWIPSSDWQELTEQTDPGDATVTLQGLLVQPLGEDDAARIPESDRSPSRWRKDSFAAVRLASPVETIPLVLVVGPQLDAGAYKSRESYPVTGYVPKPKSLPHLQYAVTWFLLAATLLTIWAAAGVKRGARLDDENATA